MPHATGPSSGFQALILCGPGASLDTFTSDAVEFPKAIVPVANRPMVWYALEWCYRLGVSVIHLITPPESKKALVAAMLQNPHLTALPLPKPIIISPEALTNTSGTAEIFRTREVREAIKSDFLVLPCDIVSEVDGVTLLQEWMVNQAGCGGRQAGMDGYSHAMSRGKLAGEEAVHRGALAIFYDTKGNSAVKGEPTDFLAAAPLPPSIRPVPKSSIRDDLAQMLVAMPTDSLNDKIETSDLFATRRLLSRKFGQVDVRTSMRDSHIYFFPYWAIHLLQNDTFDSLGEDALGAWAKASWQSGFADKIGLSAILRAQQKPDVAVTSQAVEIGDPFNEKFDIHAAQHQTGSQSHQLAKQADGLIPPILVYLHKSGDNTGLVKRVDNPASLMAVSLRLAKLASISSFEKSTEASPFAHQHKIAHPDNIAKQARVEAATCLLAENVVVGERCAIKESVIGAGCTLGQGVRLTKCIVMDSVTIGDNVNLINCVLGSRCRLDGGAYKDEDKTILDTCEIQRGYVVKWGTQAKDEKFMIFEGLDDAIKLEEAEDDEFVPQVT